MSRVLHLRNVLLAAWAESTNDVERGDVLRAMGAAFHEIMVERFPHETRLRRALNEILSRIDGIVLGQITIPFGPPDSREGSAPMAALGGVVDVEMGRRAERVGMGYAELKGTHAERWVDALQARASAAKPSDGFTGYVYPPDVLKTACFVCGAVAGAPCVGLPKRA